MEGLMLLLLLPLLAQGQSVMWNSYFDSSCSTVQAGQAIVGPMYGCVDFYSRAPSFAQISRNFSCSPDLKTVTIVDYDGFGCASTTQTTTTITMPSGVCTKDLQRYDCARANLSVYLAVCPLVRLPACLC